MPLVPVLHLGSSLNSRGSQNPCHNRCKFLVLNVALAFMPALIFLWTLCDNACAMNLSFLRIPLPLL